jgi:hypothetical protein
MTPLKTFGVTLAAILSAAGVIMIARSCGEYLDRQAKLEAEAREKNPSPTPSVQRTQVSHIQLKRELTFDTPAGRVVLAKGAWLYVFKEGWRSFTCSVNEQIIEVPKADAEIVTWK